MDGIVILILTALVVFSVIAFLASFLYQKFVPGDTRGGTMPGRQLHEPEPFGPDSERVAPDAQAALRSSATITPWMTSSRAGMRSG